MRWLSFEGYEAYVRGRVHPRLAAVISRWLNETSSLAWWREENHLSGARKSMMRETNRAVRITMIQWRPWEPENKSEARHFLTDFIFLSLCEAETCEDESILGNDNLEAERLWSTWCNSMCTAYQMCRGSICANDAVWRIAMKWPWYLFSMWTNDNGEIPRNDEANVLWRRPSFC